MAAKVKKPAFIPILATYHGNRNAVRKLIPQLAKVAMDMALPLTRFGNNSPINTHITALMEMARLAI